MGTFILQKDFISTDSDIEIMILKGLLKRERFLYDYIELTKDELSDYKDFEKIPVGTIDFVETYLKNTVKGFYRENPIEIPKYLRTDEFLKRDYSIVEYKDIPTRGKYFIKDVSQLKKFGSVMLNEYDYMEINELCDKTHLFQVSLVYDIKAEYRVYVVAGELQQISLYNGYATELPDIKLIEKAVNLILYNEKWLKSFTLDVMVGKEGTAIIEVHNFTSVGLYTTLWGTDLLYAYRDGIDYLVNDNKTIEL